MGLSPAAAWSYQRVIDLVRARHGRVGKEGLVNVLYLDSHVTSMPYREVSRPAVQALAGAVSPDPGQLWGSDSDP
jgi:prepilin-type processing-associated H-X9-DG protein